MKSFGRKNAERVFSNKIKKMKVVSDKNSKNKGRKERERERERGLIRPAGTRTLFVAPSITQFSNRKLEDPDILVNT